MSTTSVKARCHCGFNRFIINFDPERLPVSNDLCHCNTCRHSSGQMAVYHITFQGVPMAIDANDKPANLDNLVVLQTSERSVRLFCKQCSAHMFFRSVKDSGGYRYCIAAGALEKVKGIAKVGYHIYIADTLDGGMANHMINYDGVELPRYREQDDSGTLPLTWRGVNSSAQEQTLQAYCYCKALQFSITRPSLSSEQPQAAFPDLLSSHRTLASETVSKHDVKWWLVKLKHPNEATKYLAGHCVCTACRLNSGLEIQSWAFIPRCNIVLQDGSVLDLKNCPIPGLVRYTSRNGHYREFCETCGATAFGWSEAEPELVKVAVGTLAAQSGARAEDWLHWHTERVSFSEEVASSSTLRSLEEGLRRTEQS